MKKRIKTIFMCIVFMMLLSVSNIVFADNNITVKLNEQILSFDVQPQIINGRTMVPMRTIFESLGATVEWEQTTQAVTSVRGETKISLIIGTPIIIVDGNLKSLDTAPCVVSGRTLVPVRAIAEAFDMNVEWDDITQTVLITSTDVNIESTYNKYNRMGYIDVSGKTIEDIAKESDMTVEEFLEEYDLPADMPKDTNETAAFYTIPVSRMAEMYEMDFSEMKEALQWGDEITETSTWGEAEGLTKVGIYVGEENLDSFKEYYGLGDEVTADTLCKDIRNIVDNKRREEEFALKE